MDSLGRKQGSTSFFNGIGIFSREKANLRAVPSATYANTGDPKMVFGLNSPAYKAAVLSSNPTSVESYFELIRRLYEASLGEIEDQNAARGGLASDSLVPALAASTSSWKAWPRKLHLGYPKTCRSLLLCLTRNRPRFVLRVA
uniref:Uncharacterized protein n=1 Tax=Daphnia galeata TaxID=27404 RepID=A0A8J2RWC3_9CRUS|nr:unnamed protein product [Daphnia galeata]